MVKLHPATILLPDFSRVSGTEYSVIAVDQFTSEPAVWEETASLVGKSPSTLSMVLPELFLSEREQRIPSIQNEMKRMLDSGLLKEYPSSLIYLRRTQSNGKVREGLVGQIDLNDYDYLPGKKPAICATEGTVLERVPPRVDIRRGAELEFPHVMLLLNDPDKKVIEPCFAMTESGTPVYDFDLMQGGGHVTGYLLSEEEQQKVFDALALVAPEDPEKTVFAVGDGNHSLAAAKAYYEELKEQIGEEEAANHPARYALVELVNLHSEALVFRPIYRALFGANEADLFASLVADSLTVSYLPENESKPKQSITVLTGEGEGKIVYLHGSHTLAVGTLQKFLDRYLKDHPEVSIDYIHGEEALASLVREKNAIGFLFDGMEKEDLFPAVDNDGVLPRKTFSMGEARDKRYYLEARRIRNGNETAT